MDDIKYKHNDTAISGKRTYLSNVGSKEIATRLDNERPRLENAPLLLLGRLELPLRFQTAKTDKT